MSWNTVEIEIAERSQVLLWQLSSLTSWLGFIWQIKFLGNKLLCGHVQDPFSRCRI